MLPTRVVMSQRGQAHPSGVAIELCGVIHLVVSYNRETDSARVILEMHLDGGWTAWEGPVEKRVCVCVRRYQVTS